MHRQQRRVLPFRLAYLTVLLVSPFANGRLRGNPRAGADAPDHAARQLASAVTQGQGGCDVEVHSWVGDGYCDKEGNYNTAACDFDGGDCCPETCQSDEDQYMCGGNGYDCKSTANGRNDLPLGAPSGSPTPAPSDSPSRAPSDSPTLSPNAHRVVCGKGRDCAEGDATLVPDGALHEVRCCSDASLPGWKKRGDCDVWSQSRIDGKCHEDQTYCEAQSICASAGPGARLCTEAELEAKCTQGSGCGHDNDMIWSSTEGLLPDAPSAALCDEPPEASPGSLITPSGNGPSIMLLPNAHVVVCGKGHDHCTEGDATLVPDGALHEVRCCSDASLPGWKKRWNCDVWTQSEFEGKCYENKSYCEAQNICSNAGPGVRLCTKTELEAKCTQGSGCGHDNDLIWSSTEGLLPGAPSALPCDGA